MPTRTWLVSFLQEIDSVAPIQTIRVKTNTKSWLDIEVLNPIQNHDKHYKKLKNQAKKLKGIILMQNFHLKIIINKKKLLFEKKLQKRGTTLKNYGKL